MKYIIFILLLFMFCACNQVDDKQISQNKEQESSSYIDNKQDNKSITIPANNYKTILSSNDIKKLKKYDKDLFFIETKYSDEQLAQDQIYKMKNKEKELICETHFYQGNINDFYVYNHFIIYSDYDPYVCQGQYCIIDNNGEKRELATTNEFFPQLYNYQNDVFYTKNGSTTKIMKYNIQTKKETLIAEYPLYDIQLYGNKDYLFWYYDNYYYIYKDTLQKIRCQNTFGNDIDIDGDYLYALEEKESQNILNKYDIKSNKYEEFAININSFEMSEDYIIVPYLNQSIHIYEKNLDKIVELKLDSIQDICVVHKNKCLIMTDNNRYVEIDLENYSQN